MKSKKILVLALLLFAGLLLTGCTAISANSWPGVSFDSTSNTVFVAFNSHVFAVDAESGNQKWRFPQEADRNTTFFAVPVLSDDGQLVVGSYNKTLYSIDASTGAENWSFVGAGNRYIGSVLVYDNTIFAPNADERLYALDLNGNPIWDVPFKASQALWAAPSPNPDSNTLYITSMDRNVYALDPTTGSQQWKTAMSGAMVGSPKVDDAGQVLVGNFANQIVSLNAQDGQENWTGATSGWVWAEPALEGDAIYFGDLNGYFYSFDRMTGSENWKIQPDGQVVGSPLVIGDRIYFGTESGTLYAIDLRGNIVWSRETGGSLYSSPVGNENLIIVAPYQADQLLVAYNSDGNQVWTFTPPEPQ